MWLVCYLQHVTVFVVLVPCRLSGMDVLTHLRDTHYAFQMLPQDEVQLAATVFDAYTQELNKVKALDFE